MYSPEAGEDITADVTFVLGHLQGSQLLVLVLKLRALRSF